MRAEKLQKIVPNSQEAQDRLDDAKAEVAEQIIRFKKQSGLGSFITSLFGGSSDNKDEKPEEKKPEEKKPEEVKENAPAPL